MGDMQAAFAAMQLGRGSMNRALAGSMPPMMGGGGGGGGNVAMGGGMPSGAAGTGHRQFNRRQVAAGRGGGGGGGGGGGHVSKTQRFCRNIVLYGTCRNAGRGCEYNHNVPETARAELSRQHGLALAGGRGDPLGGGGGGGGLGRGMDPRTLFGRPVDDSNGQFAPGFEMGGGGGGDQPATVPRGYEAGFNSQRLSQNQRPVSRRRPVDFSMAEGLRQELQMRLAHVFAVLPEDDPRAKDIPHLVHKIYHSLYPLDSASPKPMTDASSASGAGQELSLFGCKTTVYKAICSVDGNPVLLLRCDVGRIGGDITQRAKEIWRELKHPCIVGFRDAFVTQDFGEGQSSLVLVYNFIAGAQTLQERHFPAASPPQPVSEEILWSYIAQILSGLRYLHTHNAAARAIHATKILVTGESRVRLNFVGAIDTISTAPLVKSASAAEKQYQDLLSFARLILELTCGSPAAWQPAQISKSLDLVGATYSEDVKSLLLLILNPPQGAPPTVFDVSSMVAPRLLGEMDVLYSQSDILERECEREMENGRLLRLLIKLGFINERPDFDTDPDWSEHGDRYILKLFRDYVFHQSTDDRCPMVDFGAVMQCLNKLDAGVPERLMLMSRDEKNLLIVTYADVKHCIEGAFQHLATAGAASSSLPPPQQPTGGAAGGGFGMGLGMPQFSAV